MRSALSEELSAVFADDVPLYVVAGLAELFCLFYYVVVIGAGKPLVARYKQAGVSAAQFFVFIERVKIAAFGQFSRTEYALYLLRVASKYGRVRSRSALALRIFADEMRYIALVILRVSPMDCIRFFMD